MGFQLSDDYITVAERIVEFREKYPEGSLQPWDKNRPYSIDTINGNQCFVVVAAAYRNDEDERPGVGMAYEPIPGSTPYTRGSELQNAETAAWGRAIVAVLAADTKRGIASLEEVRQQEQKAAQPAARQTDKQAQVLADWHAAIDAVATDYEGLGQLLNQARSKRAPKEILDRIMKLGNEAKPK